MREKKFPHSTVPTSHFQDMAKVNNQHLLRPPPSMGREIRDTLPGLKAGGDISDLPLDYLESLRSEITDMVRDAEDRFGIDFLVISANVDLGFERARRMHQLRRRAGMEPEFVRDHHLLLGHSVAPRFRKPKISRG